MRSKLKYSALLTLCFATVSPGVLRAQDIPVYDVSKGNIVRQVNTLTLGELAAFDPNLQNVDQFGAPTFVAVDKTGVFPVYISPVDFEIAFGGDGIIPEAVEANHNTLEFSEDEGLDTRDGLTFEETEGTRVTDDLEFSESEGLDVRPGTIDLANVVAERGPVDFFPDTGRGTVTLSDGNWTSGVDEISATGCPPGVEAAAMGSLGLSRTRSITFTKPWWHPSDMSPDFVQYTWRPVGANGYFSTPYETGSEAAGSGMSLAVTMALSAESETEIAYWGRVKMNLTPALAAMVDGSESCTAIVTGTFQRRD